MYRQRNKTHLHLLIISVFLYLVVSHATLTPQRVAAQAQVQYSYPIGTPGRPLGDGFFIRHGYTVENTWFNPGYWHTGEDWYALVGDAAGARVYAVAGGEVVYAGSNYPGRVVIVRHTDGLYAMYGHLDPQLAVRVSDRVVRGAVIGTVLRRGDNVPNHLHFELRTFLTANPVNGDGPRYPFRCGKLCPPGPGYWPITAPDLPAQVGWRNPAHVIARRAFATNQPDKREVIVAARLTANSTPLWSAPPGGANRRRITDLPLRPGARYPLVSAQAGAEDIRGTSAEAYQLWYHIQVSDGQRGWVQAAIPTTFERGSDGRASTVRFNFYPAVFTP